jgi:hypothetical protein
MKEIDRSKAETRKRTKKEDGSTVGKTGRIEKESWHTTTSGL